MKTNNFLTTIIIALTVVSCQNNEFRKSPVDELIKQMNDEPLFTILLYDMDVDGSFFHTYKHQYQIVTQKDSLPVTKTTEWFEVSEDFFNQNINNMGMEIAAKTQDGKLNKNASPPGYSNYVGNSNYGQWNTRSDGSSFWEFYGKYAMISSVFNLLSPVPRTYYNDYNTNYQQQGRAYYGPNDANGRTAYGTNSQTANNTSKSKWFSKASNSNFRNKVNSRVARSSDTKSHSNSRYRSVSRSRSGGSGK